MVYGLCFMVNGLLFMIYVLKLIVHNVWFIVYGPGCRVDGFGFGICSPVLGQFQSLPSLLPTDLFCRALFACPPPSVEGKT